MKQTRHVGVSGYVERSLDEVVHAFSNAETVAEVTDALRSAAGHDVDRVELRADPVQAVGTRSAWATTHWMIADRRGEVASGTAHVSFVVVRSRPIPITEILVTADVDDRSTSAVTVLRRALDELVLRLGRGDAPRPGAG